MSINDVNRILHDYHHGTGSYERQNSNMYNYYVNTTSYSNSPSYGQPQRGGNNGYYMSSNYL